jgi:hypothetical protein
VAPPKSTALILGITATNINAKIPNGIAIKNQKIPDCPLLFATTVVMTTIANQIKSDKNSTHLNFPLVFI